MRVLVLMWMLMVFPAQAQDPVIESWVDSDAQRVGEANSLYVKVLVPTWLTGSLYFEELEGVNLITLQASRSSFSTSERIEGVTWTGVVKEYRFIPMTPGRYTLQAPALTVQYKGDDGNLSVRLTPEAIKVTALVPEGAKGLSPLIIAEDIQLSQSFTRPEQPKVGDLVTRSLVAEISGTSALFLPPLLSEPNVPGVQGYLKSPQVSTSQDARTGALSGVRKEALDVLLGEAGSFSFEPVTLQYYQPSSDSIQTVQLPGQNIVIADARPSAPRSSALVWAIRLAWLVAIVAALLILWSVIIRAWRRCIHSETVQYYLLQRSVQSPDKNFLLRLQRWQNSWHNQMPLDRKCLQIFSRLRLLAESLVYAGQASQREVSSVKGQLKTTRQQLKQRKQHSGEGLAPLNP